MRGWGVGAAVGYGWRSRTKRYLLVFLPQVLGNYRYGKELWKLASVILKPSEIPANYGYRKVWQFGLEVAMKIKPTFRS